MRLRKSPRVLQCVIDMAPLIDVVFLLLIFFMTVSQFTRVQVEPMALSPAEAGQLAQASVTGQMVVNVDKSGRIVALGKVHTAEMLSTMLAKRVQDDVALSVLVRGDRDTSWRHVATVLRICARLGIGRVRVAVIEATATDFTL